MTTATQPRTSTQPALERLQRRAWWHIVLELIVLVLVAVVVLESFFRLCGVGGQELLEPDSEMGCRQIPNKHVTWRFEGFSDDQLSPLGHHDVEHAVNKPKDVTRIVILGDSATEGIQVPLRDTYARVFEQILNGHSKPRFEVLNFGCSSYSTGQQVLQFERQTVQYKPDITVLLYVRGAGLQNVRNSGKAGAEPRPYFYLDGQGNLKQDNGVLKEQAAALQPNALLDFLRRHSRIYGVFSQTNLALSIHEPFYNKIKKWLTTSYSPGAGHQASSGRNSYPEQNVWQVTKALIHRLNEDCRRQGSRLVVVMFPNTVHDPLLIYQIADMEIFSRSEGFGFLDLTKSFLSQSDPNSLFLQYHFSAAGHRLVAEQLAAYLKAQLYLPHAEQAHLVEQR